MYAVIEHGSKQYKVSQGDIIDIELSEVSPNATTIELDRVLLVSDGENIKVGTPYLDGAKVIAISASLGRNALLWSSLPVQSCSIAEIRIFSKA